MTRADRTSRRTTKKLHRSVARIMLKIAEGYEEYIARANHEVKMMAPSEKWSRYLDARTFKYAGHAMRHEEVQEDDVWGFPSFLGEEATCWKSMNETEYVRSRKVDANKKAGDPYQMG